jgi:hypothetical protein
MTRESKPYLMWFHDVTDLLNQWIQFNRLNLRITNETMGGDPAEDRPKKLAVFYVYNGEPGQVTVEEKDTLDLPRRRYR